MLLQNKGVELNMEVGPYRAVESHVAFWTYMCHVHRAVAIVTPQLHSNQNLCIQLKVCRCRTIARIWPLVLKKK